LQINDIFHTGIMTVTDVRLNVDMKE